MHTSVEISIVIPCFNDGAYIQEAIDSVNAQTYKNIEIVVIDDASDDVQTIQILSQLKQDNLHVIFLEKNSGPAIARNRGIERAKGKYILPLDADDKIAPTYFEKAKAVLDGNEKIAIVYCEAEFFGQETGKWDLPPYSFQEILSSNMIFATAMYRKQDWIKVGGYNPSMIHGNEDYDFWLSLIEKGCEVYQIPEVLFYYRIKETSRTTLLYSNSENEINSYLQMFNKHEAFYTKNIRLFFETMKKKTE